LRSTIEGLPVPARKNSKDSFGKRLATLRKAAGFTQQQLADKTEISRRMIAHYETQPSNPPSEVILTFAEALHVTTDQLLGFEPSTKTLQAHGPQSTVDLRLWRKLQRISELPEEKRRAIQQVIDGFLAGQGEEAVSQSR
jgi:transcriptional regulator with XRE-family HTH domain